MNKEKNVLSICKSFLLWFISIMYLEYAFRLFLGFRFDIESFLNIVFYTISISSLLSILTGIFKVGINSKIRALILFLLGVLFSVQLVFHNIFKTFFSWSNLALGDQAAGFIGEAFKGVLENSIFILLFMVPFVVYLFISKKLDLKRNKVRYYITYLIVMILGIGLFFLDVNLFKEGSNSSHRIYYEINEMGLSVAKFGVLNSYRIDLNRTIFGFEEDIAEEEHPIEEEPAPEPEEEEVVPIEIVYEPNKQELNFDKPTNNDEIKKINNYVKNDQGTLKNEYTGKFKDYNLVYITAESFYEIAIDENITPTLYRLTHSGFTFDNYYTPYVLSTIGGEFQSLTGLYPDNSILPTWRKGTNYFPYGLAKVFREAGYNTYAYHNNSYGFQDRHKYLKSQGFTNYLACYNGLEKRMNCKRWPASDDEMVEKTVKDYINSDKPFLAYYMTVSGHFQYNFKGDNSICTKNKNVVKGMKGTEQARAYVATQVELDRALDRLIKELEKAGKLDNTVFVLLADHYPYNLTKDSIDSLSTYKRDDKVEINHNALILWNSAMETTNVSKVCMSADVLPTVFNLFDIPYDSRLLTGRDILSTSDGLAIMKDRSWVTDKGTYFASKSKFVPKEGVTVDENYVKNMNSIVGNRLNISRLILKDNYYNYLMK